MASAFGALEQVDFAALSVEHVVASVDAERGLAEASIVDASAPMHVHAGQLVRVRLRVRVYRGGCGRSASACASRSALTASWPQHQGAGAAARGRRRVADPDRALTGSLSISASGSTSFGSPISSLAELRQAVAAIANYDGLYAGFPGHAKRAVYRDPSLLITGQATLPFMVG